MMAALDVAEIRQDGMRAPMLDLSYLSLPSGTARRRFYHPTISKHHVSYQCWPTFPL
jgi:hypothetical protein